MKRQRDAVEGPIELVGKYKACVRAFHHSLLSSLFVSFPSSHCVQPLFEDTTFAHVFAMFRSLHSMYAIRTIGILSFLLPSLCFACQIFCHGVLHSIRCNSEANCNGSIARITRNKNGWQILKSELCAYWHSIVMPRKVLKLVSVPLYLVKFSMTVAYVILIHEVVLSHVHFAVGGDFSPDDATMMAIKTSSNISYLYARVVNETRGGFVAYMIGVILGSYSLMAIKVRFLNKCQDVCIQQDEDESSNESTNLSFLNRGSFVSPPQLAFRMIPTYDEMNGNINPFNGGSSNDMDESYEKDHHDGLSTPLLRHLKEEVENHPLQQQHKSERTCQHGSLDNMELSVITSNPQHKVCWRDIFIFESCLISVILVFALISEPLVTFHYSGALAHIFEESVDQVLIFTFWDLITAIMRCNDRGIFSVSIAVFVGIHVIILPLLGWICHTIVLLCMVTGRYDCASKFVTFAKFTHPLHHVAPFAMSIFVASWFVGSVSEFLFDQNMVCNIVQSLVNGDSGSECLRINMKLHHAMFVLVLQAFAMDMFLVLLEK
jgi:hypothetical protein